jgi:hypothetical protein
MNELPQVLQKEIWEYVHGDRAYWKQQFNTVLKVVIHINQHLRKQVDRCRHADVEVARAEIGDVSVGLRKWEWGGDTVATCNQRTHEINEWRGLEFEEAVKLFYEKVEIEAINRA